MRVCVHACNTSGSLRVQQLIALAICEDKGVVYAQGILNLPHDPLDSGIPLQETDDQHSAGLEPPVYQLGHEHRSRKYSKGDILVGANLFPRL